MTVVAGTRIGADAARPALVGRQVFFAGGRTATITSLVGDEAMTDRAGSIRLERVGSVLLPLSGEKVAFKGRRMVWLETDLFSSQPAGWVLTEAGEVERQAGDYTELVSLGEMEDPRLVEIVLKQHHRQQRWQEDLAEDAREWADDNDLCERFDEFMNDHGLGGRRDYDAEITVTLRREIDGLDWEDASGSITDEQIIEWIAEGGFETSIAEV